VPQLALELAQQHQRPLHRWLLVVLLLLLSMARLAGHAVSKMQWLPGMLAKLWWTGSWINSQTIIRSEFIRLESSPAWTSTKGVNGLGLNGSAANGLDLLFQARHRGHYGTHCFLLSFVLCPSPLALVKSQAFLCVCLMNSKMSACLAWSTTRNQDSMQTLKCLV